jgi:hypothetical protein
VSGSTGLNVWRFCREIWIGSPRVPVGTGCAGDAANRRAQRSARRAETSAFGCPSHRRILASCSGGIVTDISEISADSSDSSVIGRLYEIAETQGGFLAAHQAVAAGIPRSTLSYHATEGDALERVGHGVYRMRRYPAPPHGHVIAGWLALARADGVVSHESALELFDLTDLIADEVHITLPRARRSARLARVSIRPPTTTT